MIDARSIPGDETIETDVCIVGAGTAGIILARELIGEKFRVCILESGGIKPDRETQSLCQGENIGYPYFPLYTARARYFGGTSNRWHIHVSHDCLAARLRPLDEIDFEEREWLPYSGWPFGKSDLQPFYERAQTICRITPSTYQVNDWTHPRKTPPIYFLNDRVETVIFKFACRDPFVRDYPGELKKATNISIFIYANVLELETDETGKTITRLRLATLQGNSFFITARLFILAAGGIETPRLLLVSDTRQNCGLGNQNDLVGRFFMEHLHWWSGYFLPSDKSMIQRLGLYCNTNFVNGVPIIGKLALSQNTLRKERIANYSLQLLPRVMPKQTLYSQLYKGVPSKGVTSIKTIAFEVSRGRLPPNFREHLQNTLLNIDEIALASIRKVKKSLLKTFRGGKASVFQLAHMSEQVPNPDSRVSLGEEFDRLGQRRVKLDWQLSPMDILSAVRAQEIINEELRRAGLGRLITMMKGKAPPQNLTGGWHHMGTTRMNNDPQKGVVDENSRVHGTTNLFIAGPSVFPTGGYANPVLTVVALTVRLADHIKVCMK